MSLVLSVAAAYLVYVVLCALITSVLLVRALRLDEQAGTVELDVELRELITQAHARPA